MSFYKAIKADLEKTPIWQWECVVSDSVTGAVTVGRLETYSSELYEYSIYANLRTGEAMISDMEEFISREDRLHIFNLISHQKRERDIYVAKEEFRQQEILAISLFPNVDLLRHSGDENITQRIPQNDPHWKLAKHAESLSNEMWDERAKGMANTTGSELRKKTLSKIWEEFAETRRICDSQASAIGDYYAKQETLNKAKNKHAW